jgi:hypothetical protein
VRRNAEDVTRERLASLREALAPCRRISATWCCYPLAAGLSEVEGRRRSGNTSTRQRAPASRPSPPPEAPHGTRPRVLESNVIIADDESAFS